MIWSKILQLIMAVILTLLVLIQTKGKGLSSSFGSSVGYYGTRRGLEKFIFILTIFLSIAIVANSLALILFS
jgi:protein translocase SecG subunit